MICILLIGGYGFIGTNIMKYAELNMPNVTFIVFDKYDSHPHGVRFNNICKVYAGDFSDELLFKTIFADNQIDIVVHSLSTTIPAYENSAQYDVQSNLLSTIQLVDAMLVAGVKRLVFFSSGGAVYGEMMNEKPHEENDVLYPINSYGVTKLAIEKYLFMYAHSEGLEPLILRVSNPYGEYHFSTKQGICNIALDKAKNNEKMTIWGNGNGRKDYIYIGDFCKILFGLLVDNVYGEIINIGSGELLSPNEICEIIHQHYPAFSWTHTEKSKYDVSNVVLNLDKLTQYIGKSFRFTTFAEALEFL